MTSDRARDEETLTQRRGSEMNGDREMTERESEGKDRDVEQEERELRRLTDR